MKASELLFGDYSVLEEILKDVELPRMFRVRQNFPDEQIEDVYAETRQKLQNASVSQKIHPGMRICITASSRGIDRQKEILKAIVDYVKELGAVPFVIPAMGSHGGATAEGQLEILEDYGITETYLNCEIRSSMETVKLGTVYDGKEMDVRIDKNSAEADGIIVFNRIKPHSAFRGKYESGLMKMMGIGMGKQEGAESLHRDGFGTFITRIFLFGNYVRTHSNVLFGVSTIENSHDHCNRIDVMDSSDIPQREPELLKYAFTLMPRIMVDSADVLVVREIGKNFSGSGMDPNISGTWATPYGGGGLQKQRVAVLDLSPESHGNALGMGNADAMTLRLFDKTDFLAMYPNVLTNTVFKTIKMPMVLKNDKMAIQAAVKTCNDFDPENPRIVIIKNTLSVEEIYLSEAYWADVDGIPGMEKESELAPLSFDEAGNMLVLQ